MSATGLSSKALQVGNKIAPIFGAAGGWLSAPRSGGRDLASQLRWIMDRLRGFKIADPIKTTEIALTQPANYPIASGISLAMVGYGLKLVGEALGSGAGPTIKGMGRMAYNGGAALAINSLVASYIYLAEQNPHPKGSAGYGPGDVNTIDVDNPQVLKTGGGYFAPPLKQTLGINL